MARLRSTDPAWKGATVNGVTLGEPVFDDKGNPIWDDPRIVDAVIDTDGVLYAEMDATEQAPANRKAPKGVTAAKDKKLVEVDGQQQLVKPVVIDQPVQPVEGL